MGEMVVLIEWHEFTGLNAGDSRVADEGLVIPFHNVPQAIAAFRRVADELEANFNKHGGDQTA